MKTQQEAPKCERKEELVDYLYDEMPLARRAHFAEHLQTCTNCSADLSSMELLRTDLREWNLSAVPHMELVIPRSKLSVLQELLAMFPLWARATMMTATAAATVLLALGTVSLFKQMSGQPETMAQTGAMPAPSPVNSQPAQAASTVAAQTVSMTPEIKALINAEVAKLIEQERQRLRAQLASLDVRNAEQRVQLQTVSRQLRELNTRQQELLAAQQPSLRSLFAEFEPGSER